MNAVLLAAEEAWWHIWGIEVAWAAGIITALGVIFKTPVINRPFKWVWRRLVSEPLGGWGKKMVSDVVDEKVAMPNGGGSLRDKVDSLAEVQGFLMTHMDESGANQADIKKALENIHACLDSRFADTHSTMAKLTEYVEEVLAEAVGARERIRQLYRGLDVPVFEANTHGFCTYANPAFCKMTGLSLEDAMGEGWAEALHPDDRTRVFQTWRRAVDSRSNFTAIYRFRNRVTHAIVEVRGSASPLHDGRDNIVGWVGTLDPLEPSSNLESELQEAKEAPNA